MLTRRVAAGVVSTACRRRWLSAQYIFRNVDPKPISSTIAKHRTMSTPAAPANESALFVESYHKLSEVTMEVLLESLEDLLDEEGRIGYEVEYSSGVLTLNLGDNGTYVINKQPPNKQIWLSSPLSGPKRYDYSESEDDWRYSRDGHAMGKLLNEELSRVFGREVDLKVSEISRYI